MSHFVLMHVIFDPTAAHEVNPDEVNELAEGLDQALGHTFILWDRTHQAFLVYMKIEGKTETEALTAACELLQSALNQRHLSHLTIVSGSERIIDELPAHVKLRIRPIDTIPAP